MKCLKCFLCMVFLASVVMVVPCGCSSNEATKIDASQYEQQTETEEDGEGTGEDEEE